MRQINIATIEQGFTPLRDKSLTGFTLLETIIAIFVLTIGISGAYALITQTIASAVISQDRLTAAYLAQEGIEIVRNIRDGNWLKGGDWNAGLTTCQAPTGCEVDYNDSDLVAYQNRYLKIDAGFYNYDSGTNTKFKRKIIITPEGADILKVSVQVEWQDKGKPYQLSAQENLYNWR